MNVTDLAAPHSPWLRAFGARLAKARQSYSERLGYPVNAQQFAKTLGVHPGRYRRYERGAAEPPLRFFELVRETTGLSLDWLIAAQAPGKYPEQPAISIGTRLRWIRELREPDIETFAEVIGITVGRLRAWETDRAKIPPARALELAHRLDLSLDYLYRGRLEGVAAPIRKALLAAHPELVGQPPLLPDPLPRSGAPASDTSTATDGGTKPEERPIASTPVKKERRKSPATM